MKRNRAIYGVIIGLFSFSVELFPYIFGLDAMINIAWVSVLITVFTVALVIYLGVRLRKQNGGYFTFNEAYQNLMVMAAIAVGVSAIFAVLLYQVIDPDLGPAIVRAMTNHPTNGVTQEQINRTLAMLVYSNPASFVRVLLSGLSELAGAALMNIIIAVIMKEEPKRVR